MVRSEWTEQRRLKRSEENRSLNSACSNLKSRMHFNFMALWMDYCYVVLVFIWTASEYPASRIRHTPKVKSSYYKRKIYALTVSIYIRFPAIHIHTVSILNILEILRSIMCKTQTTIHSANNERQRENGKKRNYRKNQRESFLICYWGAVSTNNLSWVDIDGWRFERDLSIGIASSRSDWSSTLHGRERSKPTHYWPQKWRFKWNNAIEKWTECIVRRNHTCNAMIPTAKTRHNTQCRCRCIIVTAWCEVMLRTENLEPNKARATFYKISLSLTLFCNYSLFCLIFGPRIAINGTECRPATIKFETRG